MKMLSKFKVPVIVIVVLLAMLALVAKRKMAAKAAKPYGMRPVMVHVAEAIQEPLEKTHSYLGVAEAWQTARVSSRISAKVETVPVDEGDQVKSGDLLLQLDDGDLQAQLKAAESSIQSLRTNKTFWENEDRRDSKLAEDGVITKVEAERTRNRLAEAQAKLETAIRNRDRLTVQLEYTRLTSPFDGLISSRDVDPGDLAAPGKPLMVVEDHSALKIAFDAPQEDLGFLKVGLPVRAKVRGKDLDLAVTHIYPSLDRSRMERVEVKAPFDSGIRIGAFVPLEVVWARHDHAVTVPRESLMRRGPNDWIVFTVKDGTLHLQPVKRLLSGDGRIEVEGVKPGEEVVASTYLGWANLSDGLKVEVAK